MALYMCQVLHIVNLLGSRRMETVPTSIEVLLRPTEGQSDEPSDLRGSLSPTIVYTAPGSPRRSPILLRRLTSVIEQISMSERGEGGGATVFVDFFIPSARKHFLGQCTSDKTFFMFR